MIYTIEPLPLKKWHGKEEQEVLNTVTMLQPYIDPETRRYKTGLTRKDIEWLKERGFNADFSDVFDPYKPHPLWDDPRVIVELPKSTFILNTDNPWDFIKVKFLLEHPGVANSFEEWEEGLYPLATHYFVDSDANVSRKANLVELKANAYAKFIKLSREHKLHILTIMSGKHWKNISDDMLQAELGKFIENDPEMVLKLMNDKKEKIKVIALLKEGLVKNVIKKTPVGIKFMDMQLGNDFSDSADFLLLPDNADLLARIEQLIVE